MIVYVVTLISEKLKNGRSNYREEK